MYKIRINFPFRLLRNVLPRSVLETRNIYLSSTLNVKEIREIENGKELTIYAEELPSPREPFLVKNTNQAQCPVCASGLDIKHTDVLILSHFVRSDGCMLPKRITGLCSKQQKRIGSLVTMAQKSGLMPNLTPHWSKKDPKKRFQWKKYNKYFDESTIKC